MLENDFLTGLGTVDKVMLWSQGYVLAIMLIAFMFWRERKTQQALRKLTDKATRDMAEAQKLFDNAAQALKDQYEAQIEAMQNAKGVVWVKFGSTEGQECPVCSQRKNAGDAH
jgi:uncharacterized membrane protein YgaE (UPF0421/DUF939 family)